MKRPKDEDYRDCSSGTLQYLLDLEKYADHIESIEIKCKRDHCNVPLRIAIEECDYCECIIKKHTS